MAEGDLVRGQDLESEAPRTENREGRGGRHRRREESLPQGMATSGNWRVGLVGEEGSVEWADTCADVHRKKHSRVSWQEDKSVSALEQDNRRSTLGTYCIVLAEEEWQVYN